tara:strand:- start:29 stop:214 length:186 start_codon:yes stop_codon:yes gene_type:complete
MNKKFTPKKFMLYLNIGMIVFLILLGFKDYLSGTSPGGDYWGTLIMLFAILPGTLYIQNTE